MLHFDCETRSTLDLRKTGSPAYSEHNSTQIFCACWFDDQTNEAWIWSQESYISRTDIELPVVNGVQATLAGMHEGFNVPPFLSELVKQTWSAWNGFGFDKLVWEAKKLPGPSTWIDPMRYAAVLGLPRSLDKASFILFGDRKNPDAVKALKRVCKRNINWNSSASEDLITQADLKILATYCLKDCMLLSEIYKIVNPIYSTPAFEFERKVSDLDVCMNNTGIEADISLARLLLDRGELDIRRKAKALETTLLPYAYLLSKDKKKSCISNEDKVLAVSKLQGKALQKLVTALGGPKLPATEKGNPKCDKNIIAEFMNQDIPQSLKDTFELRQSATRPFHAKATAALRSVSSDGVIRWMLKYFGAHTGRFSGSGIQPQNFPAAPDGFSPEKVIVDVKMAISKDLGSDCNGLARGLFKARAGYGFVVADLSGIELRTAFWLANCPEALEAASSRDIYKEVAASLYNKKIENITKTERQVGKVVVLSGIYQAGVKSYAKQMRIRGISLKDVGLSLESLVKNFRKTYPSLADKDSGIWAKCERAITNLMYVDSGKPVRAGKLVMKRTKRLGKHPLKAREDDNVDVVIKLPSGSFRFYRNLGYQTLNEALEWQKELAKIAGDSDSNNDEDDLDEALDDEEIFKDLYKRNEAKLSCDRYQSKISRDIIYGSKIFQCCNQSLARDILADAMLRIEEALRPLGGRCVLSVHDEVIVEAPLEVLEECAKKVGELLTTRPDWAQDLPLGSEVFTCSSYRKEAQKDWAFGSVKDGVIVKWTSAVAKENLELEEAL